MDSKGKAILLCSALLATVLCAQAAWALPTMGVKPKTLSAKVYQGDYGTVRFAVYSTNLADTPSFGFTVADNAKATWGTHSFDWLTCEPTSSSVPDGSGESRLIRCRLETEAPESYVYYNMPVGKYTATITVTATTGQTTNPTATVAVTLEVLAGVAGVKLATAGSSSWHGSWSPDGLWLAYQKDDPAVTGYGQIWKVKYDGTGLKQLTTIKTCDSKPAWSPDGSLIAFQRDAKGARGNTEHWASIYVVKPDGTGLKKLAGPLLDSLGRGVAGSTWPVWSGDSQYIAFKRGGGDFDQEWSQLWVVKRDGTGLKQVTKHTLGSSPIRDDVSFKPAGAGANVVLVASLLNPTYYNDSISSGDRGIALANRATGAGNWITRGLGTTCQQMPSWKPDGTKIAYMDDASGQGDIWVMSSTGSGKTRLTNSFATDGDICYSHPNFSPDGKYILYYEDNSSFPTEHRVVGIMTADGKHAMRLSGDLHSNWGHQSDAGKYLLKFNKQKTRIVAHGFDSKGNHQLYVINLRPGWEAKLLASPPPPGPFTY